MPPPPGSEPPGSEPRVGRGGSRPLPPELYPWRRGKARGPDDESRNDEQMKEEKVRELVKGRLVNVLKNMLRKGHAPWGQVTRC